MKVLVMIERDECNIIETIPESLFYVPFPGQRMEKYHQDYLIEALKLNLGIDLSPDYRVKFENPYLFVTA